MSAPSGGGSDDNFKNVTLLLNGNGTNGAQNNTFVDSSSNNFSITRNGNTTQGSFSPYGSLWSNFFQTTGSVANNPSVDFSPSTVTLSGDFTLECWISPLTYATGSGTNNDYPTVFHVQNSSNQGVLLGQFGAYGTGTNSTFTFMVRDSGEKYFATATIPLGQWTHVAMVRSGSTITAYVNGTSVGSRASTETWTLARCGIGAYTGGLRGYYGFNGNISNFRLTTTAVYTTTFTPSIAPLTAITNTQLLTCQSNRFIDNSSNNFTPTTYGSPSPSVQRFSPFNPTASYSTATIGGSGYFDNASDYLTKSSFSLSSDFSIGFWVYSLQADNGYNPIFSLGDSNTSTGLEIYCSAEFGLINGGNNKITGSSVNPLNQWNYVLLTRSSGVLTLYVNGTQTGSTWSSSTTFSGTLYVGAENYGGVGDYYNGYMSDFFVNNTTAVSATVPTAPLTNSTGNYLLLNFTNAGIPDYAMMNDLETVGNAQVSTSVKKFGTGSLAFDGTGDELKIPSTSRLVEFGTGNFTIECWFYAGNTTSSIFFDSRNNSNLNNPAIWWSAVGSGFNYPSKIVAYLDDNFRIASGTLSTSTWYHVALVRSGTTVTLYIDGTSAGTYTYSTSVGNSIVTVGDYFNGGLDFTGNIDDLRISKIARYTANFTPPTAALPVK